jgi:hypothetical protein
MLFQKGQVMDTRKLGPRQRHRIDQTSLSAQLVPSFPAKESACSVCTEPTCLPASQYLSVNQSTSNLSASEPVSIESSFRRPTCIESVNLFISSLPACLPVPSLPTSKMQSNLRRTCHPARTESVHQRVMRVRVQGHI